MSNDSSSPMARPKEEEVIQADSQAAVSPIRWNPYFGTLFVIVVFFVAQVLAAALIGLYPLVRHWSAGQTNHWLNNAVAAQFSFLVLAEGLTLLGLYGWLRHFRARFATLGLARLRPRYIVFGLLAAPLYYLAYALLLTGITQLIPGLNLDQKQEIGFDSVQGTVPLLLTFISVVIIVPITEEILVRGFLYGSLRKALPVLQATILTSLIFAAAHLPEGGSSGPLWIGAIDTFTLSLFLCYLREKTGSLWPSITLHTLKNGIAFAALFLIGVH